MVTLSTTLYSILCGFAVYFSNYIYSKIIFAIIILLLLFHLNIDKKKYIMIFILLCLSLYNPYFIICIVPFLPNKNHVGKTILINTILLRFFIENSYFTGYSSIVIFYYLWGAPIILLSVLLSVVLKKYSHLFLIILCFIALTGQIIFNKKIEKADLYTLSDKNAVVANYDMLKQYQPNISMLTVNKIKDIKGYFILPISENKDIVQNNYISEGNIYLLLAEHDNLNDLLDKYPYFNNDAYQILTPWNLYRPNFILPFKYITDKDIFYSSNIGATVQIGYPLIWEYSFIGKPKILASLANINNSKVFLWGDSDFLVSKLIPYNILLVEKMLGKSFIQYNVLGFIYLLLILTLIYLNNKKIIYILIVFSILQYFYPIHSKSDISISVYPQFTFYSAHNKAHVSSFLNMIAQSNIPIKVSDMKNSNVIILSKRNNVIDNFKKAKIIYLFSGASIYTDNRKIECSNIKIGTDRKNNVIDARYLIENEHLIQTSLYKNKTYSIICTGSPQLNTSFIKEL